MIYDITFWLYGFIVLVSGMGVFLFLANWIRVGEATVVYKYVTGLLFGLFLKGCLEFYSFVLRETGNYEKFIDVIHSSWWDLILILTLVPLTALVWKMYYRFFIKRKNVQRPIR